MSGVANRPDPSSYWKVLHDEINKRSTAPNPVAFAHRFGPWSGDLRTIIQVLGTSFVLPQVLSGAWSFKLNAPGIPRGVIVKGSVNGQTLVWPAANIVVRVMDAALEPEFLSNVLTARRLYPHLTPLQLGSASTDSGLIVATERFYKPNRRLRWRAFNRQLDTLMPQLLNDDAIDWKSSADSKSALSAVTQSLESTQLSQFDKLNEEFETIRHALLDLITALRNDKGAQLQLRRFSHGDLMPSNIILVPHGSVIVDWTNGGFHNFAFDLMVTEVYSPASVSWSLLGHGEVLSATGTAFRGQVRHFQHWYQDCVGEPLKEETLRCAMLISLAEFTLKKFKRYQSPMWYEEGSNVLEMVSKVLDRMSGR